jgi:hypothetical protein
VHWLPSGKLVSGTAQHKIRLYDVEAQKRPVVQLSWLDARITALAPDPGNSIVWAANAKGFIQVHSDQNELNPKTLQACDTH